MEWSAKFSTRWSPESDFLGAFVRSLQIKIKPADFSGVALSLGLGMRSVLKKCYTFNCPVCYF